MNPAFVPGAQRAAKAESRIHGLLLQQVYHMITVRRLSAEFRITGAVFCHVILGQFVSPVRIQLLKLCIVSLPRFLKINILFITVLCHRIPSNHFCRIHIWIIQYGKLRNQSAPTDTHEYRPNVRLNRNTASAAGIMVTVLPYLSLKLVKIWEIYGPASIVRQKIHFIALNSQKFKVIKLTLRFFCSMIGNILKG